MSVYVHILNILSEIVYFGIKMIKFYVRIEAIRIHYNFSREHSKFGKTPAEISGIKIEGENKLLTLIQNATQYNYA